MRQHHLPHLPGTAKRQRGVALIAGLMLLLIITIIALGMFRSFGTQEKLGGNVREKERALHAALSAQQYAEWWLVQPPALSLAHVTCAAGVLNANSNGGQICLNQLYRDLGINPANPPWTIAAGAGAGAYGVQYLPPGMSLAGNGAGGVGDPPYFAAPVFYIADMGTAYDNLGEAYLIDAVGYGGSANAVAVVESTYEVSKGVTPLSGSQ